MVCRIVMLLPNEANSRDHPGVFLHVHRCHTVLFLITRDGGDTVFSQVYHDIRRIRKKPHRRRRLGHFGTHRMHVLRH